MNIFLVIFSFLAVSHAQISVPGKYRSLALKDLQKNGRMDEDESMLIYNLPELDNAHLLAEVEAKERVDSESKLTRKNDVDGAEEIFYSSKPSKTDPFTFGKAVPLNVSMISTDESHWIINADTQTRMWRFKVYSKDAHSISIYFSDFYLKPSAELYIIGLEDTLGAFTSLNNKEDRVFGIAPVSGDFLILEYIEPIPSGGAAALSEPSSIVVSHIVHGFRPNPFSLKSAAGSGNCHINVACQEGSGKANAINSVGLLINGKGTSFCTGAMVNNANGDGRQLFLTAEHCVGSDSVKNFMVGFHYQFKYCNSAYETKPQIKTVHGMRLLDKTDVSDFALLEVVEEIPNDWDVYMAGWDASSYSSRTGSFYGIHHPRGDTKKISLFNGEINLVRLSDVNDGVNFLRIPRWEKGSTEPGSSGSPLFDANGLIIGHLFGGDSSCSKMNAPDYYGALSRDWMHASNSIRPYLDPNGTVSGKQVRGAALKDLRTQTNPQNEPSTAADPAEQNVSTVTITVTQSITKHPTATSTVTIAKTTIFKEVTKTVKAEPVTITQTFTRVPPPIISVRTVTVTK